MQFICCVKTIFDGSGFLTNYVKLRQLATVDKDIELGTKAYIKVVAHWESSRQKYCNLVQGDSNSST